MKYDLTSGLIFFRPVIKVKYINICKAGFDWKHMVLFLICQLMWDLEGIERYDSLIEQLLVLHARATFVGLRTSYI